VSGQQSYKGWLCRMYFTLYGTYMLQLVAILRELTSK